MELQKQKIDCFKDNMDGDANDDKIDVLDKQIAEHLLTEQRKQFEKELVSMKELRNSKGKTAMIFNLKDKVVGKKKAGQEATVLKEEPKSNLKKLLQNYLAQEICRKKFQSI